MVGVVGCRIKVEEHEREIVVIHRRRVGGNGSGSEGTSVTGRSTTDARARLARLCVCRKKRGRVSRWWHASSRHATRQELGQFMYCKDNGSKTLVRRAAGEVRSD